MEVVCHKNILSEKLNSNSNIKFANIAIGGTGQNI